MIATMTLAMALVTQAPKPVDFEAMVLGTLDQIIAREGLTEEMRRLSIGKPLVGKLGYSAEALELLEQRIVAKKAATVGTQPASHGFPISQEYDKFRDVTTLHLEFGVIWGDAKNKLDLDVYRHFSGQDRTTPRGSIAFHFFNHGEDGWHYLDYHPVTFLVDGERMQYETEHKGDVETGYVTESLWVHPTLAQFGKMTNAKSIEIRVGLDQVTLSDRQRAALVDFADYIKNPSRKILEASEIIAAAAAAENAAKKAAAVAAAAKLTEGQKRSLLLQVKDKFKLARNTEQYSVKRAIEHYQKVISLAEPVFPDLPEVEAARERLKALGGN